MSYSGGIKTRLDTAWGTNILGPDGKPWESVSNLAQMRARSRNLERQSPLAWGILDRGVENVIGTGMSVRPKSSDEEFNKEIADLWAKFTDGKTADIRRTYSWGKLQQLSIRHEWRDGDCGFVLVDRTELGTNEGVRFPELQFVGGEHIATPTDRTIDYAKTIDGIEYNSVNAPVAYWIKGEKSFQRVEARDFVFLHSTSRYNVGRGEPRFEGSYTLFDQLEGFVTAVVVAARVGASQALIRKRKKSASTLAERARRLTTENADGIRVPGVLIEPGTINDIDAEGEELIAFNPSQPQQTFPSFLTAIARMLGLKFGLTVERVLLDFSGASYSVSRSTTLQEIQAAAPHQDDFNASFLARVYPWFVAKCVKLGYVKTKAPVDAWAYEWVPPGRPLNDPAKELAALELGMKLGVMSPEDFATAMGWDWGKLLDTIKRNKADLAKIGIAWPTDSKAVTAMLAAEAGRPIPAENAPPSEDSEDAGTGETGLNPRELVDAYGIAVRAGAVTPQIDDEKAIRKTLAIPEMSDAARAAWAQDGVRRPITIAGDVPAPAAPTAIDPNETSNEN